MKPVFKNIMFGFKSIAGLFIGIVKGEDARTRWMNKMKNRKDNKQMRVASNSHEVLLDDFEIQSFHN